jgi:hypothetical protein
VQFDDEKREIRSWFGLHTAETDSANAQIEVNMRRMKLVCAIALASSVARKTLVVTPKKAVMLAALRNFTIY